MRRPNDCPNGGVMQHEAPGAAALGWRNVQVRSGGTPCPCVADPEPEMAVLGAELVEHDGDVDEEPVLVSLSVITRSIWGDHRVRRRTLWRGRPDPRAAWRPNV